MTVYRGIKCHGNIQLAEVVINRLKDLGYHTGGAGNFTPFQLADIAAHGIFIEKGTRKITMPINVKLTEDEVTEEEADDITWLNLHRLFNSEEYRWTPPEKHLDFHVGGHNSSIRDGKLFVGCHKITFETVDYIHNAIQDYKKEMNNEQ